MVKHQPLQVYEKQLCLSCLTGIYGCRWKRYQRSHDSTTKWECLWTLVLVLTFSLLLIWSYFWWEAHNDYNEFNWVLYNRSGEWSDGTVSILATTAVGFTYITFLMILALGHVAMGQQLNLHWLHKIGVTAALLTTITGLVSTNQIWGEEWDIVPISLQATGPFLHIGAVAAGTALAWLVAGQVARAERTRTQVALVLVYLSALLALYLLPLNITSPCLMDRSNLRPPPAIIGHRGAPMLAPENTLMSFHKAVQQRVVGLEADVAISLDGVPFLMRDRTLRRTTDVSAVFPERQFHDASLFNWTDLRALNAGRWFLKDDPFWTVQAMSERDRVRAGNQTVCSLEQLLRFAARSNVSVLFNLRRPPQGHPRRDSWVNDTLETVLQSGIRQEQVMWTPDWDRGAVREVARGLQQTSEEKRPPTDLRERGIVRLQLRYNQASAQEIREFSAANLSLTLSSVNDPWLFSVLWCSGVPSVSSDAPQILRKVPYPVWLMSPDEYNVVWIATDLVSFAIVIGIFVFQKWRFSGMQRYNPEQIMLSAAVRRSSRDVNIMKEKLIFSEVSNGIGDSDELSVYAENGYDYYSNQGIAQ
ncbi:glycerophosphodiester phosphodiesterase domain-containing protein 5 isoform X2 [Anguilla anguilla]|uniref:glycerophosphodiester phosphodiesterase domain-containing protein 5 isoform X2 n=1 Tax=Anguilla anguilla TaxID=7936 RepID=UPI0015B2BC0E|nr:glycerophosphodiester phosphodiesterase domain-containing protein 5 isoform X2 [Anguilla anguilla]